MITPAVPVGFNYSLAILQILKVRTYEDVAQYLGYESVGSISGLIDGSMPSHPVGEAIFVLYREIFGKKPPMSGTQAAGVDDLQLNACPLRTATV